jgi:hypothetical protein
MSYERETQKIVAEDSMKTIKPKANDSILLNPGMGVLILLRGVNKPRFEDVPPDAWFIKERITDKILVDVPWSVIEPHEGEIEWDHREWEGCFNSWIKAGYKVALQVRSMGSLGTLYSDGTPQWVFDAGAKFIDESPEYYKDFGTRRPIDDRPLRAPVYWDPVCVEKASNLARALGKRYNGNPNIEFIVTGHMGKWGEMHVSVGLAPTEPWIEAGLTPEKYLSAHMKVIDVYHEAFPDKAIVQELGGLAGKFPESMPLDFYTVRELIPFLMERKIGIKANGFRESWSKDEFGAKYFHACYPRIPVMHECWAMFCSAADARATANFHGSYWNRGGEAEGLAELHILGDKLPVPRGGGFTETVHTLMNETTAEERKEIWRIAARNIGYRFGLGEISFPESVHAGRQFQTVLIWTNHGAAPCYRDYCITLSFFDSIGRIAWEQAELPEIPTSSLLRDRNRTVQETLRWRLPTDIAPGRYTMSIGMCDRFERAKRIALAMDGDDGTRRYAIGKINVQ